MAKINQELYNIDKYRSVVGSLTASGEILTNTLSGTEDKMVITANGSLSGALLAEKSSITIPFSIRLQFLLNFIVKFILVSV